MSAQGQAGQAGYSFLGGAGFDLITQGLGAAYAAAAASKAHDRQKNFITRGPTYQMIGLQEAGLNPILAAKGGFGGASVKAPTVAPSPGPATGASHARNRMQADLVRAQVDAANASAESSRSQANKHNLDAALVALGIPRAQGEANYYATPEGRATIERGIRNAADPNDPLAMILKRIFPHLDRIDLESTQPAGAREYGARNTTFAPGVMEKKPEWLWWMPQHVWSGRRKIDPSKFDRYDPNTYGPRQPKKRRARR